MTQTVLRSSARAVSINLDQPVQLVRSQYHDLLRLGIKPSKADQKFKITPTISVGSGGFYVTSRVDWRLVRNGDVELTRITGEEANEEGSAGHGTKSPRYYLTTDVPAGTEVVTYAISMAEAEPSGDREVTVHAAKGLSLLIESVDGSPFDVVERFVASELSAEDGGTVQPPVTPPTVSPTPPTDKPKPPAEIVGASLSVTHSVDWRNRVIYKITWEMGNARYGTLYWTYTPKGGSGSVSSQTVRSDDSKEVTGAYCSELSARLDARRGTASKDLRQTEYAPSCDPPTNVTTRFNKATYGFSTPQVTLSWSNPSGATRARVKVNGGYWVKVNGTFHLVYDVSANTTYSFELQACYGFAGTAPYSSSVTSSITTPDEVWS